MTLQLLLKMYQQIEIGPSYHSQCVQGDIML